MESLQYTNRNKSYRMDVLRSGLACGGRGYTADVNQPGYEDVDDFDDLLSGARRGESWAFKTLFEWLGARVLGYLRSKHVEDPDGLANEVFLRVFRTVGSFDGDADRFRSWVFTIAHNLAIDAHRRSERRPLTRTMEVDIDLVGGDVEEDVLVVLARERVEALLATCSAEQRDVLMLRFVNDLSVAETAEILGKSQEAVKGLQRRALAAVERALASEGVSK